MANDLSNSKEYGIEYNLHKDGSWVMDCFETKDEAENHIIVLKSNEYFPRRKYPKDNKCQK